MHNYRRIGTSYSRRLARGASQSAARRSADHTPCRIGCSHCFSFPFWSCSRSRNIIPHSSAREAEPWFAALERTDGLLPFLLRRFLLIGGQREGGSLGVGGSSLCGIAIVSTPPFLLHQWGLSLEYPLRLIVVNPLVNPETGNFSFPP